MFIQSNLFRLPNENTVDPNSSTSNNGGGGADGAFPNNPKGMADRFAVPFLGSLPMDPNMMRACEEGKSFLETFPKSVAAAPFASIVAKIVDLTTTTATTTALGGEVTK